MKRAWSNFHYNFNLVNFKMATIAPYLTALRPWTLSASLTPVLLGTVLCYKTHGYLSVTIAVVSTFTVLAVHAAGNLVNTYFDFIQGVDSSSAGTEDRTLVDRHLKPTQVVNLAAYLYGFGMTGLWILIVLSPAQSEQLAGLFFGGLSSSFLYSGGIGLKYYAVGDVVVIITFGPLAVLFSYVVQCGCFSSAPLLLAFPLALNTEAIIHSKHTRSIEEHQRSGIVSLAVLLGHQGSYLLFALLLFLPYLIFIYWTVRYSGYFILPIITVFYTFSLERKFRENRGQIKLSSELARLNLALGLLQVASCIMATNIPALN